MSQQLKGITDGDVARSSSSPPTSGGFYAKAVTVHDGDTCDLVFIRNGKFERFKSRLSGINSPELKTGNPALKSRDFLAWLCIGQSASSFPRQSKPWSEVQLQDKLDKNKELIYAEFQGTGGFGRPLVTLMNEAGASKSFNALMMENGYASKY